MDAASRSQQCLALVVDDNAVNREVAVHILQSIGFESEQVSDGKAAVEWCANHRPDVVLMDIEMPIMDGIEATRVLRQLQKNGHLNDFPIIAVSAYPEKAYATRCLAAGMDAFMAKPLDVELLEHTIRRSMEERAKRSC